jgi:RNA polymerase sigma-70 factor, ECF subfamily
LLYSKPNLYSYYATDSHLKFNAMTAIEFQYQLTSLEGPLMNFAYSLTSDKNDAKDLVQETFLKALKYCDKFVHDSNFKGWIFTIMRNTFINEYHRLFRYTELTEFSNSGTVSDEIHANYADNPMSQYRTKELENIIDSLNDEFRLPFKLFHEGYKYKEIAELLNINIGTVKSRIFVARRKMIKQLN